VTAAREKTDKYEERVIPRRTTYQGQDEVEEFAHLEQREQGHEV
jgi:hypothetical protein